MEKLLDILLDTLLDAIKLLPFLLIAYLIMEWLEHKTTNKTKQAIMAIIKATKAQNVQST